MTNDTVLDTSIAEPSMTAGEVEMLIFALDRSRAQFAWKCGGLDDDALHKAHPPSAMTLGGIVKHLAFVDDWTAVRLAAHEMPAPWRSVDWDADPDLAVAFGGRRLARGALPALE
ncbi:MAG TPA: DUF664 domain-containing protein [Nakamurella sp.]|nr:DUF664 domain-containing protein [Nakamurella sp.]